MQSKNPFINAHVAGHNVDPSLYHGQTVERGNPGFTMSRSQLMEFDRCPHRWKAGYELSASGELEWGSLVDCLALDPLRFDKSYAVAPLTYPATPKKKDDPIVQKPWNRNANFCIEWEENQIGKTILQSEKLTKAKGAVTTLLSDKDIAAFFKVSQRQVLVTADYKDADTGLIVPLKFLIDLVPNAGSEFRDGLGDLKTSTSAAPGPWTRAVFDYGYHVQAAMYLDAWNAATGEDRQSFFHVLQENFYPFETTRRLLSLEFVEIGRFKYLTALRRYARCVALGQWPGYDDPECRSWRGWRFTEPEPWMINK